MSHEQICKALKLLGVSKKGAEIYIFLAKKGPYTAKDLSQALNIKKPQAYESLRILKDKEIITATPEVPALLLAVPFEHVIDLIVKAKIDEAQSTQQMTNKALRDWKLLADET